MFIDYQVALTVALLMAILLLAQLLIADVVSLQRKHPPGVLLQANATGLNVGALLYFCARVAHMLCYYGGWALARSVVFVFSLLGLFTMLAACIARLWF